MSSDFRPAARPTFSGGLGVSTTIAATALSVMTIGCGNGDQAPESSATPTGTPVEDQSFSNGKVVRVIDGATIEVDVGGRTVTVRYLELDVPDPEGLGPDGASIYERGLQFNRFLVEGRDVEIERGGVDIDAAGRLLRYVYVDGEMVNEAVLTNGYATLASFPQDFEHKTAFAIAQESAKEGRRGYWEAPAAGSDATPPPSFGGGTLPRAPDAPRDFSTSSKPVIKGNVDRNTGERIYHVPGSLFYSTTVISEGDGDRLFCTEVEALNKGWKRSKR